MSKQIRVKVEGQTTGILEEKLKLEAEVGTLKEQLEKRRNEVEASFSWNNQSDDYYIYF